MSAWTLSCQLLSNTSLKKDFLEIEALAGAFSVCSKSLIVWLLQFMFRLPSKLIHLSSAISHIVIHPGVASFPASCQQSVRNGPLLPKCRVGPRPVSLSRKKTLLGQFLPFSPSTQEQQPKAEEKDSQLNFNVGQTPNEPGAFYLLRGYYNENEIPCKSFNCRCCLSCKREGRESEMWVGVEGRSGRLILVSVTDKSEKYGRGR